MLTCYSRYSELDIQQILAIYAQARRRDYYDDSDFLEDISLFFRGSGSALWTWTEQGTPVAAVRTEPYKDGYLISCLETAPQQRRRGFGRKLLLALLAKQSGIYYAHVDKRNHPSLALHKDVGFAVWLDHAVHVDGSVYAGSYTLRR